MKKEKTNNQLKIKWFFLILNSEKGIIVN